MSVAQPRPVRRRLATSAAFGGAWLVPRRLRSEPGAALATAALVGATCFVFAAMPRLFNGFADDGLRYSVAHAPLLGRALDAQEPGRIGAGDAAHPLANVAARSRAVEQTLPRPLRSVVAERTFVIRSDQYGGAGGPGLQRVPTLVAQSGIRAHIRIVAGRFPAVSRESIRARFDPQPGVLPPLVKRIPVVEVALSVASAKQLHMRVGDRAVFTPGRLVNVEHVAVHDEQPIALRLVGLFAVKDRRSSYWFGDTSLETPNVVVSNSGTTVYADALVSPEQYSTLLRATRPLPLAYEYRYYVDPRGVDAGRLASLRDATRRLEARYAGATPFERRIDTGLDSVLVRYTAERSRSETLLAIAALALLACAVANLVLLSALTYDRRRSETAVSRTRGALPLHLLVAQLVEGLIVAVPAGVLGWVLALAVVRDRGSSLSTWLALGIVVGTVLLFVAVVVALARRGTRPDDRADVVGRRVSTRRLVLEGLVVGVAGLGVYLLRRRGLASESGGGSFDPYLASVPVLLGLACGIAALRLYPLPVAAAARALRRTRGLALHLGLSRAARQSEIALAPLLVLLLAIGVGVFSATMLHTLDAGQARTAWQSVGADVRVDALTGRTLPAALEAGLARHGTVAAAYVREFQTELGPVPTLFLALDTNAYERAVAGTPAAGASLRKLAKKTPLLGFVPAIVSPTWPSPGTFQLDVPTQALNFVVVGHASRFPGLPRDTPFAITSLRAVEHAANTKVAPTRLYLRGIDASEVRRIVRATAPSATVTSRADAVGRLRGSPLVDVVFRGFRAAIVVAAVYAAVALALMVLIAARSRSRDLALVRTMGGSSRDALVLAGVELTPFVVVALALGIGLGVAIPYLISPGLGLAFFTGNASSPISVPWPAPVLFAAGVLALAAAAVYWVGARARRAQLQRVLRIGER